MDTPSGVAVTGRSRRRKIAPITPELAKFARHLTLREYKISSVPIDTYLDHPPMFIAKHKEYVNFGLLQESEDVFFLHSRINLKRSPHAGADDAMIAINNQMLGTRMSYGMNNNAMYVFGEATFYGTYSAKEFDSFMAIINLDHKTMRDSEIYKANFL